ncbi:hypothetical protein GCM10011357_16670 [Lacimicrobium alkaliphilum]|uniref:Transposase n=1 Tax=Lacimicrobium alkaliphilum TaxID=1526571 RepID=A0ABQ1RBV3_9ALTE|nr:hypothetical protein GCM10011357_16670 [Lacimicrobium alkaliphilum]
MAEKPFHYNAAKAVCRRKNLYFQSFSHYLPLEKLLISARLYQYGDKLIDHLVKEQNSDHAST